VPGSFWLLYFVLFVLLVVPVFTLCILLYCFVC